MGSAGAERPLICVGVVGTIACGKSACVEAAAAARPAWVRPVSGDALGHAAYGAAGDDLALRLAAVFGPEVLGADGAVDRAALGRAVFDPDDPGKLERLNGLVWPAIHALAARRLADIRAEEPCADELPKVALLEAACLVEARWFDLVDAVIVVREPPVAELARRLRARNPHLAAAEASRRIAAQPGAEARLARLRAEAPSVVLRTVDGNAPLDEVREEFVRCLDELRAQLSTSVAAD